MLSNSNLNNLNNTGNHSVSGLTAVSRGSNKSRTTSSGLRDAGRNVLSN